MTKRVRVIEITPRRIKIKGNAIERIEPKVVAEALGASSVEEMGIRPTHILYTSPHPRVKQAVPVLEEITQNQAEGKEYVGMVAAKDFEQCMVQYTALVGVYSKPARWYRRCEKEEHPGLENLIVIDLYG